MQMSRRNVAPLPTVRPVLSAALIVLAAIGLAGCQEAADTEAAPERIRAIKSYTVVEPAGGMQRNFSGTLTASETSALSFAVGGTVETVTVEAGDAVSEGDVLATLDTETYELDVAAARSELASAQGSYNEKRTNVDRQRELFEKGWVAKAALDQAEASFDVAEGQLNLARSKLAAAERNLGETRLLAPFDGVIASRDVEPFQEVRAGEPLFQINARGGMEVELSVSDSVVNRIAPGAPVRIDVSTLPGCGCSGRITEIGVASGTANVVTVTAALTETPPGLLPGMSAEVSILLGDGAVTGGFFVPFSAIAVGDAANRGYVFVFDPEAGVVRKTPVMAGGSVRENLVAVRDGVAAGDIIASAGVSFLRDGQRVRLMGE